MRKALVVGINHYTHVTPLWGCVNDAKAVKHVLVRNGDGALNFSVKTLLGLDASTPISRSVLKEHVRELFAGDSEVALFYFAGHGHLETTGGYLLASDAMSGDEGLPLVDVLTYANGSPARNRVIVLDSCHSGIAGANPAAHANTEIKEGTTILTASTAEQYASEQNGAGVFTMLLVDALNGAAGNLMGDVTPGSVYAHIDQSLGPWDQRPVFKTNVKSFVSLRKVEPPITLHELRRLTALFPSADYAFPLDPTFEPERDGATPGIPDPIPANTKVFAILQKYNRVNLVVPVGAPHMWHAAMHSKTCQLTVLGKHYRKLVERSRI
jgi:hypothetical protein